MVHQHIITSGSQQKPIAIDVSYLSNNQQKPLVLFVHGFKGFKDWGHFNVMANYFAEKNFVFAKFNFSHNGTTIQNPLEFDDLDAFGENNYLFELDDIDAVLNNLLSNDQLKNDIDTTSVYLIGHSRGGAISIIKAFEDSRIKKIATWAAVSDIVTRNSAKTIETWKEKGVVYTYNGRTKQQMPLNIQFYNTIIANKNRLHVTQAASQLTIPFLIIHGTNDEAVKEADAHQLHESCKHSQLCIIENANHTFDGKHPWIETHLPKDANIIIDKTIAFFNHI